MSWPRGSYIAQWWDYGTLWDKKIDRCFIEAVFQVWSGSCTRKQTLEFWNRDKFKCKRVRRFEWGWWMECRVIDIQMCGLEE